MATAATRPPEEQTIAPELILGALAETLDARPSGRGPVRIGVLVVDGGPLAVTLAPGARPLLASGVDEDVDLRIVTNAVTLVDLVRGAFDPSAPGPEHLFLFDGDPSHFGALAEGLAKTQSWLGLRVDGARSSRRRKRKGGKR